MEILLSHSPALKRHIMDVLHKSYQGESLFPRGLSRSTTSSAVLFLLGNKCGPHTTSLGPCMVFNKRSHKVKQPGDLCFPGGRVSPRLDGRLSKLLTLPVFPLSRWPYWHRWRDQRPREARRLALLLATSLRESLEEMRLNPLGIQFLGPMPAQSLHMFDRIIYPMVGWITHQKVFFPNWEVEKVVHIPLRELLNPLNYARYRIRFNTDDLPEHGGQVQDFSCFLHEGEHGKELLWGATHRIVMVFLKIVFGFNPPDKAALPLIHGALDNRYLHGAQSPPIHQKGGGPRSAIQ